LRKTGKVLTHFGKNKTYFWSRTLQLLTILLVLLFASKVFSQHRIFELDSLKMLESEFKDKPFLLLLWSTECPPCRDELKLVKSISTDYPDFNFLLLSTDTLAQVQKIDGILASNELSTHSSWLFSKKNSIKLRYAVDPNWYGELPRSYFYNEEHQRKGISGKLSKELIVSWLEM